MSSILDCPICQQLPQKSSESSLPEGADRLTEGPGDTRHCPECRTWYYYSYDYDRGEPMVPETHTYTLSRFSPVLAVAHLEGVAKDEQAAAQPFLDALARDWDPLHGAFAAALGGPLPALPHVVKYLVESLSDYYLEKDDQAAFSRTLLTSRHGAVRANAATDFLYVATEEHAVWTIRMFSRHQQKLAAVWLQDDRFKREIVQTLASCLSDDSETRILDSVLGDVRRGACETAYFGLMNAFYRNIDAAPIIPALLAALVDPEYSHREIVMRLLEDAATAQPAVKPMIRKALKPYSGAMRPEVARVLKAARARSR